jgi:hypothetical protein
MPGAALTIVVLERRRGGRRSATSWRPLDMLFMTPAAQIDRHEQNVV